jgi:hypothetical protein
VGGPYSDESDFEDLATLDDETFEKLVAMGKEMQFENEEDARAWFEQQRDEAWVKERIRKEHRPKRTADTKE